MSSTATPEATPQPVITSVQPSTKRKRLALDIIGQLEDDLKDDPLNYVKWLQLISLIEKKDKVEQVRATYEKFLGYFSLDSKQWIGYINYELNRGEFEKVEELFGRCLLKSYDIELSRFYISYVCRVNDIITGGEQSRGIVLKAFEFVIENVGIDIDSNDLWNDYLNFIKNWNPINSWEKQTKIDLVRKIYRKFIVLPILNLEENWINYTSFENDLNSVTARKFISEKSGEYMLARSWIKEFQQVTEGLDRDVIINNSFNEKFNESNRKQINCWKNWIFVEKKNKLDLSEEQLNKRIEYVYIQSIKTLKFFPEFWFEYSNFLLKQDNLSKAIDLLIDGIILNPTSFLLSFQLAELYEKNLNYNKMKETYNSLIKSLIREFSFTKQKIADDEGNTEQIEEEQSWNRKYINQLGESITLAYSKLMSAVKRTEGIKEARLIFKEARTFEAVSFQIFIDNAYMEHYANNTKVALRIFENGMKKFSNNGNYLLSYLNYLMMINDDSNIRVVFETGLTKLKADVETDATKAKSTENDKVIKKLFKSYIRYESNYGDLNAVKTLESRYYEIFPDDNPLILFGDRYKEENLDFIKTFDLGMQMDGPKSLGSDDEEDYEPPLKKMHFDQQAEDNDGAGEEEEEADSQFVSDEIYNLLRILPNASYFTAQIFNPSRLVKLLKEMNV